MSRVKNDPSFMYNEVTHSVEKQPSNTFKGRVNTKKTTVCQQTEHSHRDYTVSDDIMFGTSYNLWQDCFGIVYRICGWRNQTTITVYLRV